MTARLTGSVQKCLCLQGWSTRKPGGRKRSVSVGVCIWAHDANRSMAECEEYHRLRLWACPYWHITMAYGLLDKKTKKITGILEVHSLLINVQFLQLLLKLICFRFCKNDLFLSTHSQNLLCLLMSYATAIQTYSRLCMSDRRKQMLVVVSV